MLLDGIPTEYQRYLRLREDGASEARLKAPVIDTCEVFRLLLPSLGLNVYPLVTCTAAFPKILCSFIKGMRRDEDLALLEDALC